MRAGWLDDLTEWLWNLVAESFGALWELVVDALLYAVEVILDVGASIIEAIPVPEFLESMSLCALFSAAGPTVGWALQTFNVGESLGIIAGGYAFRLLRKLITLGQW